MSKIDLKTICGSGLRSLLEGYDIVVPDDATISSMYDLYVANSISDRIPLQTDLDSDCSGNIVRHKKEKGVIILKNSTDEYIQGIPSFGIIKIFEGETDRVDFFKSLGFIEVENSPKSINLDFVDTTKLDISLQKSNITVYGDTYTKVCAYLENYLSDDILLEKDIIDNMQLEKLEKAVKAKFLLEYNQDKQLLIIANALSKLSDDKDLLDMIEFYKTCVNDPFSDKNIQ